MKAKLIGYTQPTKDFIEETGGKINDIQSLVAFCARVSNSANQLNSETANNLLTYLIRNKHFSPFELVSATMEIETTRDIARQVLRHRSFSFNEFSQRYADPTKDLDFVLREARLQDEKNRQNSIEIEENSTNENGFNIKEEWARRQQLVVDTAKVQYQWAIENGIAKEQARAVLPEGNTMSRLYMSGTIRSWIHFIELRSANGTQKEHMEVANACAAAIAGIFPLISNYVET